MEVTQPNVVQSRYGSRNVVGLGTKREQECGGPGDEKECGGSGELVTLRSNYIFKTKFAK